MPYVGPLAPLLPDFQVREEPAFTYTGVDFAGSLSICSETSNNSDKALICLFMCLVTRAVHLDVVPDLSTEIFIRGLKRFFSQTWLASPVLVRQLEDV